MGREVITSAQNPKIKELLALQEKGRLRREKGVFVVEGRRELAHCLSAGFQIRTLFICPEICPNSVFPPVDSPLRSLAALDPTVFDGPPASVPRVARPSGAVAGGTGGHGLRRDILETYPVIEVSRAVYEKVAYREGTEGVIAEVFAKERGLADIRLSERPLVIVLEAVEKPGNLGAVLRSADAAGADAVLVCDPATDLYNPNLIRASIGSVFTRQVAVCTSEEAIAWLKSNGIRIYTAQLQDSSWYYETDMTSGTAIVMGTESTGLTDLWREAADAHIKIPMLGQLDSLNVSVSAAILLFEAVRQRNNLHTL